MCPLWLASCCGSSRYFPYIKEAFALRSFIFYLFPLSQTISSVKINIHQCRVYKRELKYCLLNTRGEAFAQQFTSHLGCISSPGHCPAQKLCDEWRETQRWARRMVKENTSYEGRLKELDLFSLEVKQRRLRKCKQKAAVWRKRIICFSRLLGMGQGKKWWAYMKARRDKKLDMGETFQLG